MRKIRPRPSATASAADRSWPAHTDRFAPNLSREDRLISHPHYGNETKRRWSRSRENSFCGSTAAVSPAVATTYGAPEVSPDAHAVCRKSRGGRHFLLPSCVVSVWLLRASPPFHATPALRGVYATQRREPPRRPACATFCDKARSGRPSLIAPARPLASPPRARRIIGRPIYGPEQTVLRSCFVSVRKTLTPVDICARKYRPMSMPLPTPLPPRPRRSDHHRLPAPTRTQRVRG